MVVTRRWRIAAAFVICASVTSAASHAQNQQTPARPIIELEKTRFTSKEQVFFWVGVTAPDDYRIPQALWTTCRLIVTHPDGTRHVDVVGWPVDGMLDRSWRGGHTLRPESIQLGRYVVVFEFAGQQTEPQSFTVEDLPILREINGDFGSPSPLLLHSPEASAVLTIHNRSNQTIRFPHRGVMFENVAVMLNKTSGERWAGSFFVPQMSLLKAAALERSPIAETRFSWALADRVPTVVLAPGSTYRLELPWTEILAGLGDSQRIPAGEYEVRLSTTVQVLVGERNGPFAELSPLRLTVTSVAPATLSR
ncbi:MAG: hypothetical protein ACRD3G_18300 [Vicinamibacterales bacterium]